MTMSGGEIPASPQSERLTVRGALLGLNLLMLLAAATGCGAAGARENIWQAIEDTQAAVRSVELAVDLFQHDRTTQAATAVTAQDMSDQIGMAQQQLVDVPAPTPELRGLRAQ
jgi:hypothetical protein